MFFKHFASKNQLPVLTVNGTLVENGLIKESKMTSRAKASSVSQIICKLNILRMFAKFTRKHPWWHLSFNNVVGFQPANSLNKKFGHRCSLENFWDFFKNPFFTEHFRATASGELEVFMWSSLKIFQISHKTSIKQKTTSSRLLFQNFNRIIRFQENYCRGPL